MPNPKMVSLDKVPSATLGRGLSQRQKFVNAYCRENAEAFAELERSGSREAALLCEFSAEQSEALRVKAPTEAKAKDACRRAFRKGLESAGFNDFTMRYEFKVEALPDGQKAVVAFRAFVLLKEEDDE